MWREYKEGIAGGPAVEQLEQQWQWRWRPAAAQRTAWSRRKTVLDEVERLLRSGASLTASSSGSASRASAGMLAGHQRGLWQQGKG
jgi:hypothetical protein